MEAIICKKCGKELPILIRKINRAQKCPNCTRKSYYRRNKKTLLERSKKKRYEERVEKIKAGKYKWGSSQKSEEEKFKFFMEQNYIHIDVEL